MSNMENIEKVETTETATEVKNILGGPDMRTFDENGREILVSAEGVKQWFPIKKWFFETFPEVA